MKEIHFKIDADGEITMEVKGATGADCEALSAPFEAGLGVVAAKNYKPEYFESKNETEVEGQSHD